MYYRDDIAVLPTRCNANPATQVGKYCDPGQVGYVILGVDQPTPRYLTSFGSMGWDVGQCFGLKHDQNGRQLGYFEVIGIVDNRTGERRGRVAERPIPHWVLK